MVNKVTVKGFEAFMQKVQELEKAGKKEIFCLFTGSVDASGNSWCPDCDTAKPVVEKCLENLPESAIFLYCYVGERDYWKNKSNDFRVHPKLKLTGVPTLLKWGEPKRLVEGQLLDSGMINMMFED